jgi:hypothetical protein
VFSVILLSRKKFLKKSELLTSRDEQYQNMNTECTVNAI